MAEAVVTLPDGRRAVLRAESIPELHRRAGEIGAQIAEQEEEAGTSAIAFNNAFGARMLNAASGLAETVADIPGRVVNPLLRGAFANTGVSVHDSLPAGRPATPPQIPAANLPSGNQIAAALESPLQAVLAGQSMADAYGERMADRQRVARDRPAADFLGGATADAAQLAALRAPLRGGRAGGAFDGLIERGTQAVRAAINPSGAQLGAAAAGSGLASLGGTAVRGLGRAAEAGFEGALIGTLQGGDPVELAAVGAGAQAAGSIANTGRTIAIGEPGKFSGSRTALTIAAGSLALGALYTVAPGDAGSPIQWLEDNLDKALIGAVGGILLGMAGRRGSNNPGTLGGYFPGAADVLSTMPRASILELARGVSEDQRVARAMQNASALGESDSLRFTEIMRSDAPLEGLEAWMDSNERVRRILSAPDPRLAQTPVRDSDA